MSGSENIARCPLGVGHKQYVVDGVVFCGLFPNLGCPHAGKEVCATTYPVEILDKFKRFGYMLHTPCKAGYLANKVDE